MREVTCGCMARRLGDLLTSPIRRAAACARESWELAGLGLLLVGWPAGWPNGRPGVGPGQLVRPVLTGLVGQEKKRFQWPLGLILGLRPNKNKKIKNKINIK